MTLKTGRSKSAGLFYVEPDPSTARLEAALPFQGSWYRLRDPGRKSCFLDVGSFHNFRPKNCIAILA